jgi:hypothetical protein
MKQENTVDMNEFLIKKLNKLSKKLEELKKENVELRKQVEEEYGEREPV